MTSLNLLLRKQPVQECQDLSSQLQYILKLILAQSQVLDNPEWNLDRVRDLVELEVSKNKKKWTMEAISIVNSLNLTAWRLMLKVRIFIIWSESLTILEPFLDIAIASQNNVFGCGEFGLKEYILDGAGGIEEEYFLLEDQVILDVHQDFNGRLIFTNPEESSVYMVNGEDIVFVT